MQTRQRVRLTDQVALGFALLVAVAMLAVVCGGLPSPFVTNCRRSRESECKANLKGWYTAERVYRQDHGTFSPLIRLIGFVPERGNRYAYFASRTGSIEARSETSTSAREADTGVSVDTAKYGVRADVLREQVLDLRRAGCIPDDQTCSCADITAVCAGNIDDDPALDVWSISTLIRTGPDGAVIAPGVPFNEVSDRAVK